MERNLHEPEIYDFRQHDRLWQRVGPGLEPYPETTAEAMPRREELPPAQESQLPGAEPNPCCMGSEARELLAVLAAAGILSSRAVTGGLLYGLKFLYMTLVVPVLELMVRLLAGTLMGISWIFSRLFKDFSYEMPENALDGLMAPEALPGFEGTAASETPAFLKFLGTLAAAAALLLFFWFLYRMLSGRGRETDRRPVGTVRRSQAAPETGKRAGAREYMGDRGVRYYFRKFLKLCIAFQLPADERSASSETVCSDAVCSWGMEEEITAFRDLYRKVRYGEKEETEAFKREAREIYKKVKKKGLSANTNFCPR